MKAKTMVKMVLLAVLVSGVPAMADFGDTFDTEISGEWDTVTSASVVTGVATGTYYYPAIGGGMAYVAGGGTLAKTLAAPEQGDLSVYGGTFYNPGVNPIFVAFGNSVENSLWLIYYNSNDNSIYARFIYQGTTVYNKPTTLAGSDTRFLVTANVSDAGTAMTIEDTSLGYTWSSAESGIGGWDPYLTSVDTFGLGNGSAANMFFDEFSWITAESTLLPGDANRDGVVSAGDYASVQSNFGNTGAAGIPGDANLDGVVSAGDYASVQANFGSTLGAGAVPEPATMTVLAFGICAVIRRRTK